jgi:thiamine biosynthesis lipoprotein
MAMTTRFPALRQAQNRFLRNFRSETTQQTWQWTTHTFRAMNTDVHLWRYGADPKAADKVEALFRKQERHLSRFSGDSDLSRLNHCPKEKCPVSEELFAALEVALWAANATGGIYDPTILADLQVAGYDRTFDSISEPASFRRHAAVESTEHAPIGHLRPISFRNVDLLVESRTVCKPTGLGIDLGGMGKGWTVDRAADLLHGQGPFLVNAGGDLYAYGQPGDARGWRIELEHPLEPAARIATVWLTHHGLATSTVMKRRWLRSGHIQHHLIDPRSGQPAQTDALSVTVTAQRTVLADVFAKVALVLGVAEGLAWLEQLPGVEGCIFTENERLVWTAGFEPLFEMVGTN